VSTRQTGKTKRLPDMSNEDGYCMRERNGVDHEEVAPESRSRREASEERGTKTETIRGQPSEQGTDCFSLTADITTVKEDN
jgi:hypothetical protein